MLSVVCGLLLLNTGFVASSYNTFLKKFDVQPLVEQADEVDLSTWTDHSNSLECAYPTDCTVIQQCNHTKSGVYQVFPFGVGKGFLVYCDMVTQGGGWLVFQRRQDGSVDFYRNWQNYTDGFGNLYGEFWLGLQKAHLLTSQAHFELLVNMKSYTLGTGYASYSRFRVADESQSFRLLLGTFKGNAGDSLGIHNGLKFTTYDRDNDYYNGNCAVRFRGAWWYNACHRTNLNGRYVFVKDKSTDNPSFVTWSQWSSKHLPLQFSEMKIRPMKIH
ncbi:fibrinogen C domain-containing protein 1-B-like [Liolophura sinensis]|uniref:fibrinogen C domain-containing protein 1-B-like n=1 Tax=Liolophura sinensis TaxID=3198878 RepID=UPI0031597263